MPNTSPMHHPALDRLTQVITQIITEKLASAPSAVQHGTLWIPAGWYLVGQDQMKQLTGVWLDLSGARVRSTEIVDAAVRGVCLALPAGSTPPTMIFSIVLQSLHASMHEAHWKRTGIVSIVGSIIWQWYGTGRSTFREEDESCIL